MADLLAGSVLVLGATIGAGLVAFEVTYNSPGNKHGPVEFVNSLFWTVIVGAVAGVASAGYLLWT